MKIRGKKNAPTTSLTTARAARAWLAQLGDPERAEFSKRYFKTGKREYGDCAPDERAAYLALRSKDGIVPRRMRRRQ